MGDESYPLPSEIVMIDSLDYFSRRRWLKLMLATGGILATGSLTGLLAQSPTLTETPNMVLGPFYPQVKSSDKDTDLTMIRGHRASASGQVIHLSGRVLNNRGEPVRNARIEIWQTNSHGRYAHRSDPNTAAPLDRNFQGFAAQTTDHEGHYKIK